MLRLDLMTDRRFVVMREDHPLADRPTVDLAELAEVNWVMESFRDRFVAACTNLGFAPRVATADDAPAIQALVASGVGASLMSELALHADVFVGVACRPLSNWSLRRTYLLLWPGMLQVTAVAAAVRVIRATLPGGGGPGPRSSSHLWGAVDNKSPVALCYITSKAATGRSAPSGAGPAAPRSPALRTSQCAAAVSHSGRISGARCAPPARPPARGPAEGFACPPPRTPAPDRESDCSGIPPHRGGMWDRCGRAGRHSANSVFLARERSAEQPV
ncbi:LysR family transcriptional regulator substrate-binding protein [Actinacidiphila rubida]|uniref:LysR substrate binding domain-containing protein n=1 Tax=Actinacidiphila rubida TaxID=310780 RepID=A0A1H8U8Z4_9ACTN|nr:LysR family transcriptional regulator substrate-binding protein [Actinacidiphila rubida]SEO99527.1 LysR substrate binding domain-containing protein [Actinacidiphila rubida]